MNTRKFGGVLPRVQIRLNPRLRALTGRVFYESRVIELSGYHVTQPYGRDVAIKTLEHEMLHLYLDIQGRPAGHTRTFKQLAERLGIAVWHSLPYPRNRVQPVLHVYECPSCAHRVVRTRRLSEVRRSACGACCRAHGDGRFDERFLMKFVETQRAPQEAAPRPFRLTAPAHHVLRAA